MPYTLRLHQDKIRSIGGEQPVKDRLQVTAEDMAADARGRAPKATGMGAASIHIESTLIDNQWHFEVSWDPEHFYMLFQEVGTLYFRGAGFLRSALMARNGKPLR